MADQDPASLGTAYQQADQIETPKLDFRARLGNVLAQGDKNSPIAQAVANHNQRRMDEAHMHKQNAATAAGAIIYDNQMLQKAQTDPDSVKGYTFLTPEERQSLQNNHDTAMDAYEKIVGVDKNTKTALGKARGIVDHLMKRGAPQQGVSAPQSPSPNQLTPPPAAPGAQPATPQAASGTTPFDDQRDATLTPPPTPPGAATSAAPVSDDDEDASTTASSHPVATTAAKADSYKQFQTRAPFLRQQLIQKLNDAHKLEMAGKLADIDESKKIAIEAAKAKAMAANPRTMRYSPKIMGPQLPEGAMDINGQPITADRSSPETVWTTFDGGNHFLEVSGDYFTKVMGNRLQLFNKRTGTMERDISSEVGSPVNLGSTSSHTAPGITLDGRIAPVTTTTSRKPITAGAPARPGGLAAPPTPGDTLAAPTPATTTSPAAARPQVAAAAKQGAGANGQAIPFSAANQLNLRIIPVREAATQILGDANNPDSPALKDFADIADNPKESKALANALQLTFDHMEAKEKAQGGLTELLANYGGLPQALVDSETGVMKDVVGKLSPRNQQAYDATMAAFGAMTGFRALNKSSAAKFSVQSLERELPLIGRTAFSKAEFNNKLSHIAEQVHNGMRSLPIPEDEKKYYDKFITKQGKMSEPPAAPGAQKGPSQKALDFIRANP